MYNRTVLSHQDAMTILTAIRERADQKGDGLALAIVDDHGELLAFLRTDGCRLPSILIAQNKAYSAAREQKESAQLGESSRREDFPMTNFGELRYVTWGGGLPIFHHDLLLGAVGVSGLTSDEDIEYARFGIDSWMASLNEA